MDTLKKLYKKIKLLLEVYKMMDRPGTVNENGDTILWVNAVNEDYHICMGSNKVMAQFGFSDPHMAYEMPEVADEQ